MRIEGSAAIVTGGASGLGHATAHALADRGAAVLVLDLAGARERVEAEGRFAFAAADVRDAAQVGEAIRGAQALGPLRVLVNCAGVGTPERVLRRGEPHALESFERTIGVNLVGTFNVLRLAAAAMAENEPLDGDRGVIVNTASIAAFDGQAGQAAYAASKGGIVALTLTVARDLADVAIRCVTIAPGLFDTPLFETVPAQARRSLEASVPHPSRLGAPPEFAALAVHAVENPLLNGAGSRLDGGLRMAPR